VSSDARRGDLPGSRGADGYAGADPQRDPVNRDVSFGQ
jgi:hypothetical protein